MFEKISWWTVAASTVVTIIVGFLFLWIFVFPSDNSLNELVSQKEKAVQVKIDSLKNKTAEFKKEAADLKLDVDGKPSYQAVYGLSSNESRSDIPRYDCWMSVKMLINSSGIVTNIDTLGTRDMFVPPIQNWRNWKNFEHVPTQIVSTDTTDSSELGGEKYVTIDYQLRPVFESSSTKTKEIAKKDSKETPVVKQPVGKINF